MRSMAAGLLVVGFAISSCTATSPPASQTSGSDPLKAEAVPRFVDRVLASSKLVYFSDYFSFVGEDSQGHMAFAIDNNRGRDVDAYQAEHLVFLHDEKQGWLDVPGVRTYQPYEDKSGELRRIPDSPVFSFEGEPSTGLVIRGLSAPLVLTLTPLELKVIRSAEDKVFAMASAPAQLQWKDRTLQGRVIYEYLVLKDQNRLSRGMLKQLFSSFSFQGLYLMTPNGHDLYMHKQEWNSGGGEGLAPLLGFYNENDHVVETQDLRFEVTGRKQGPGLFRWPASWMATWATPAHGTAHLEARASDLRSVRSLLFGGYAMGIVRGTVEQEGKQVPVYGWSELVQWLY
jgi:hypothetical protein